MGEKCLGHQWKHTFLVYVGHMFLQVWILPSRSLQLAWIERKPWICQYSFVVCLERKPSFLGGVNVFDSCTAVWGGRCEVCHVSTRTAADFAAHNAWEPIDWTWIRWVVIGYPVVNEGSEQRSYGIYGHSYSQIGEPVGVTIRVSQPHESRNNVPKWGKNSTALFKLWFTSSGKVMHLCLFGFLLGFGWKLKMGCMLWNDHKPSDCWGNLLFDRPHIHPKKNSKGVLHCGVQMMLSPWPMGQ